MSVCPSVALSQNSTSARRSQTKLHVETKVDTPRSIGDQADRICDIRPLGCRDGPQRQRHLRVQHQPTRRNFTSKQELEVALYTVQNLLHYDVILLSLFDAVVVYIILKILTPHVGIVEKHSTQDIIPRFTSEVTAILTVSLL